MLNRSLGSLVSWLLETSKSLKLVHFASGTNTLMESKMNISITKKQKEKQSEQEGIHVVGFLRS